MQKARIPLTNFQYGEISPSLVSRTDSAIYNSSAQSVKNFFIRSEGGVSKRGGFQAIHKFAGLSEDTNIRQQIRIIPFIFSDDEQYIIALSHQACEIFFISPTDGTLTLVTTLTTDVNGDALPWDEAYIHEITYAQGGDIMFLAHNTFMCQQLIRTGLNSFQVEEFDFQLQAGGGRIYQPYYSFQSAGVTLDPSATTGTGITVTTSANYFDTTGTQTGGNYLDSKHVGTTLLFHEAEIYITSVQSATQATGNIVDELEVPSVGTFQATMIAAGIPTIFLNANDIGYKGTELQGDINGDEKALKMFETIRAHGAVKMGLINDISEAAGRQHTPKVAFVAPAENYVSSSGKQISQDDIDLNVRALSMGLLHHAMMGTAAVAIATAAAIPGTLVNLAAGGGDRNAVRFGHPSGTLKVGAKASCQDGEWSVDKAIMSRSARVLMEGTVRIPGGSF